MFLGLPVSWASLPASAGLSHVSLLAAGWAGSSADLGWPPSQVWAWPVWDSPRSSCGLSPCRRPAQAGSSERGVTARASRNPYSVSRGLSLACCHFCCVLLASASHRAALTRGGEVDGLHLSMGRAAKSQHGGQVPRRAEELGPL